MSRKGLKGTALSPLKVVSFDNARKGRAIKAPPTTIVRATRFKRCSLCGKDYAGDLLTHLQRCGR